MWADRPTDRLDFCLTIARTLLAFRFHQNLDVGFDESERQRAGRPTDVSHSVDWRTIPLVFDPVATSSGEREDLVRLLRISELRIGGDEFLLDIFPQRRRPAGDVPGKPEIRIHIEP